MQKCVFLRVFANVFLFGNMGSLAIFKNQFNLWFNLTFFVYYNIIYIKTIGVFRLLMVLLTC